MQASALRGNTFCVRWIANGIRFFCLCVGVLLISLPAFSQGNAGRILGSVTDQTGGAMAGATVTILDVDRGQTRTLVADDAGQYNAPNLLPGNYTVRAEAKGFKTFERTGIILEVNKDLRVDCVLQPGEQTQKITVTEALPMVETTNATLGGTLQSQIIDSLPLNGHNFENLLQLRPGTTIYPGGSGWAQSTNGQRAHDNVYMVDGVYSSDAWMGQSVMNAVMAAGDAGTLLPVDAIDEFNTQQNPKAEYGWKPGGIVNVGLKSGTNTFHGTGYAYGRDSGWDSLNYFLTSGGQPASTTASPNPPLAMEQFGATFGGPIVKDKVFFFTNFEDQRYLVGSSSTVTDPITSAGVGTTGSVLTTNNLLEACQLLATAGTPISPVALQIAGLQVAGATCTAKPNYPGLFPVISSSGGAALALNNTNRIDSGLGKVDWHLDAKNSFNFMYFISPGSGILNDAPGSQTNPVWLTNQYARSQAFSTNWTWTPSASLVNEARVGYSHYYQIFQSQDSTQNPANYTFAGANGTTNVNLFTGQTQPFYYGFPSIAIGSNSGTLGASWPKIVGPDGTINVVDHISYLRGKHAFKFGGEIVNNQSTSNVTANAKGTIDFGTLEDFFTGGPNNYNGANTGNFQDGGAASVLVGNLLRHFAFSGYALFLQDDWRVKPRLTVNLGLRYEINTVPVERDGLQGNFNPNSATGVVQTNSPYAGDHNNLSPRLGVAWDIFGNGKTVLRAGAGMMYEQLSLDVLNGIGNSFGLRVEPTGDALCTGGAVTGSCKPGAGTITVANISYSQNALNIPFANAWLNNSGSNTLFSFSPACGDGNTPLTALPTYNPPQCSAIWVQNNMRTPYITNYNIDIQRAITSSLSLDIGYVGNHGTKLLGALDLNQDPSVTYTGLGAGIGTVTTGPGWTAAALVACAATPSKGNCAPNGGLEQTARPYNAAFPYFKYIDFMGNMDTSNYNALQATLTARNYHGLTLTTGYTYSHALGESSDQGTSGGMVIPVNSYGNFAQQLYTSTNFDIRQRLTISGTYNVPGWKTPGQILEGWSINFTGMIQGGTPWGVSDATTDFSGTGEVNGRNPLGNEGSQWSFFGNASDFEAIHDFANVTAPVAGFATDPSSTIRRSGIPFYTGSTNLANAPTADPACNSAAASAGPLSTASLRILGCYALGSSVLIPAPYGGYGNMGRNPFRDQGFRNLDLSIAKQVKIKERLTAQFRAEFFNILNHPNFANPLGGPGGNGGACTGTLNPSKPGSNCTYGYVGATPNEAGSNPLGTGGPREIQLGLKLQF